MYNVGNRVTKEHIARHRNVVPDKYKACLVTEGYAWKEVIGSVISLKTGYGAILPMRKDGMYQTSHTYNTVYVNGLNNGISERAYIQEFLQYGTVVAVNIAREESGTRLGYGYIQYEDPTEAAAAVYWLHGTFTGIKEAKELELEIHPDGIKEQAAGKAGPRFGLEILSVIWDD